MKKITLTICALLSGCGVLAVGGSSAIGPDAGILAGDDRFPGSTWLQYATPEEAGFSAEKLEQARRYADEIGSEAVMVIYRGAVLAHWGPVETRFMCHSVRKSFLSALYGIQVDQGTINLDETLAELGIDDEPPLSDQEKQARVRDLLKSRSGVYHPAAYEAAAMKAARPARGSHTPGTFYYYNNWDFNVLGTLLDRKTGSTIFREFQARIAVPLEMQDYRARDGYYHLERQHSIHPAYPFRMSARDMARFGLLYLREGRWKDRQILSKAWVRESSACHSTVDAARGYGYLWWTINSEPFRSLGAYAARGVGGHCITVVPGADLVFVHRVRTWWDLAFTRCAKGPERRVANEQRLKLLGMILEAKVSDPRANAVLVPLAETDPPARIIPIDGNVLDRYAGAYDFPDTYRARVARDAEGSLLIQGPAAGTFALLPRSETEYLLEDLNAPVTFRLDGDGKPLYMAIEFTPGERCLGRPVAAGGGEPNDLASLAGRIADITPALLADHNVPGASVSVIWDGRIAWHGGFGVVRAGELDPVTPDTVFEACSMSKVAFTYVALKLVEQGKLDLDTPLVEYLPQPYLPDEPLHKLITARMVLIHTTGFPNWREGGWRKGGPLPVQWTPGTKYGYSGEGYLYLQRVVEQISGSPLNDLMDAMLFGPLGMVSSSYVWQDRYEQTASAGHDQAGMVKANRPLYREANAAYSLYCTPDDYARFIIEVMKEDRSGGHSLTGESIENMLTPFIEITASQGNPIPRSGPARIESVHRGLGWVIGRTRAG
ncbi:MAG: serine hydrolase, partial [Sedimentisphaerales bacterium]|nr:serine hydrolase [Sedimentisphaerales bacterium]